MTQPIPTFDSWWELNNRSLPVHDPYELARAVAERFSGPTCKPSLQVQPPQQEAGEALDVYLHMQGHLTRIEPGEWEKCYGDMLVKYEQAKALQAEVASLRAALASQADAGRLDSRCKAGLHSFSYGPGPCMVCGIKPTALPAPPATAMDRFMADIEARIAAPPAAASEQVEPCDIITCDRCGSPAVVNSQTFNYCEIHRPTPQSGDAEIQKGGAV